MTNTPSPAEANGDVGAPKEWYSRSYLPHRDAKQLLQAVTFRLADSLPQEKLTLLEEELSNLPENQRTTHRREKIEQWQDASAGTPRSSSANEDVGAPKPLVKNFIKLKLLKICEICG